MPISESEWEEADITKPTYDEVISIFEQNPDKAYTAKEIADQVEPEVMNRNPTKDPNVAMEQVVVHGTFVNLCEFLVHQDILETRTSNNDYYYRIS